MPSNRGSCELLRTDLSLALLVRNVLVLLPLQGGVGPRLRLGLGLPPPLRLGLGLCTEPVAPRGGLPRVERGLGAAAAHPRGVSVHCA